MRVRYLRASSKPAPGLKVRIFALCQPSTVMMLCTIGASVMTAAGTVQPAKAVVFGAGVAGLMAIATARRLGCKVEATDVRIAAGEMTRQLHELRELIAGGCVDVVQPDAALVGGITGLRRIAVLAQEYHLAFTPHTWTNGMGVTANAQLVAGLSDAPFLEYPFDPPEWTLERRDFLMTEPLQADAQGWIQLTDAPGMGYTPDEDRLRATRIA